MCADQIPMARSQAAARRLLMRALTAGCLILALGAAGRTAQVATAPAAAGQTSAPVIDERLKPMLLSRTLFTPDHWWKYDGSDLYPRVKARFASYILAQSGTVSLGRGSVANSGARVLYGVIEFASEAEARRHLRQPVPARSANTKVFSRDADYGDGAHIVSIVTYSSNGVPKHIARRAQIRWGRYVVRLLGDSNMRAFVPRPARGERPWLHEPVMQRVMDAAIAAWSGPAAPRQPNGGPQERPAGSSAPSDRASHLED